MEITAGGSKTLALDVDIENFTDPTWQSLKLTLGKGFGDTFIESTETDDLFFHGPETNLAPVSEKGQLPNSEFDEKNKSDSARNI